MKASATGAALCAGSFRLCPFRPFQPPVPVSLESRLCHFESGLVTVGVELNRARQTYAVARPEKSDSGRNAPAFIDATDIPGACENTVIDCVRVDAVAESGRTHCEGHQSVPTFPLTPSGGFRRSARR